MEPIDISLASRIISQFSDFLPDKLREPDGLKILEKVVLTKEANVIKLPNISASTFQLKNALSELRGKGYNLPDFLESSMTTEEKV